MLTGVLIAFLCAPAMKTAAAESNTLDPADVAKGKGIFRKHCAGCHGTEGRGDGYKILGADPANLTSAATGSKSDSDLLRTIHEGKGTMPSWKGRLSTQKSRQVLAYIRSLSK